MRPHAGPPSLSLELLKEPASGALAIRCHAAGSAHRRPTDHPGVTAPEGSPMEPMKPDGAGATTLRWWQGLDRYCWVVLAIAALGWLFDTMDQNLFNLVRAPSLQSL